MAVDTGAKITVFGDGTQRRDYTHIDDVVSGLQLITELNEWWPEYELGSGKRPVSTGDIAQAFADALGVDVVYTKPRPFDPPLTLADITKQPPGWEPRWTVEDYLDEVIDSYRRTRLSNSTVA
jgi:nucleoside-diphosphate-sugar epimerase